MASFWKLISLFNSFIDILFVIMRFMKISVVFSSIFSIKQRKRENKHSSHPLNIVFVQLITLKYIISYIWIQSDFTSDLQCTPNNILSEVYMQSNFCRRIFMDVYLFKYLYCRERESTRDKATAKMFEMACKAEIWSNSQWI